MIPSDEPIARHIRRGTCRRREQRLVSLPTRIDRTHAGDLDSLRAPGEPV